MRRAVVWFNLVALCLVVGWLVGEQWPDLVPRDRSLPPELAGPLSAGAKPLEAFGLIDHLGAAFTLERMRGRYHLIFFGYTHCPDVCPEGLHQLAQVLTGLGNRLPDRGEKVVGVLVSVDPGRDTPAILAEYVGYFHPRMVGVTGTPEEIAGLARQMGAFYRADPPAADGAYGIMHSSGFYLVDSRGRLAALFAAPHDPLVLTEKLITILRRLGEYS